MKSDSLKLGPQNAPHRALYHALGLTEEEVSRLSKEDLRLARNEVYARYGRLFNSPDLQDYFNSKSWYHGQIPADQFDESVLNDYERQNLDAIRKAEERIP